MAWSFSIGRIFGSELRVHVTFLILLGWIALSAYAAGGAAAAIWNTAFILVLFACVVAHEFGHALMARRFGIRTPDVTLLPIGGLARLDRMPDKPSEEIAVALAGPAVNLVIWALLTLFLGARANPDALLGGGLAGSFLDQVALANLYLLAFNLLPAFPMDGGRVLRAIMSASMGRSRGTAIAARVGQALAVAFGLYGLFVGNPFLVLIAAFVFFAAQGESGQVVMDELGQRLRASDAMISEYVALSPDDPISTASDAIIRTTQHEFPVTNTQGHAVGFLSRQDVFSAISADRRTEPVSEFMRDDLPAVSPRAKLGAALAKIGNTPAQAVLVVDASGVLQGYITKENLAELMMVTPTRS